LAGPSSCTRRTPSAVTTPMMARDGQSSAGTVRKPTGREEPIMPNKAPQKNDSKKPGKSLKEKRADKKAKKEKKTGF
jgi:hypothetical protein